MKAALRVIWPRLRQLLPAIGIGAIVLGLVFHPEAAAAMRVWDQSTAYGHCWLVLPIALWLLWERHAQINAVPAAPLFWPALAGLPLVGLWLAADLLGVMEGRQIAALGFLELVLLAVCGWRLWWALSAGFLYLIFLVPFGAFLTPAMQGFTAAFVSHGLDILGIPNRVTSLQIEIPEGTFFVAEACAGLRFLIASIAFGVLYAVTIFTSFWRRAAYIAVACVVPVIANGFRALGIVSLGHVLGSAQAAATDHVLYGWIFFSFVILLLALLGMPFRQDPPSAVAVRAGPQPGLAWRAVFAAWPVLLVAASGPVAGLLAEGNAAPGHATAVFVTPPQCDATASEVDGDGASQSFVCGQEKITAELKVLPARANPARVVAAARDRAVDLVRDTDFDNGVMTAKWGAGQADFAMMDNQETGHGAAYVLVVDGVPLRGGLHDRIALAKKMLGGSQAPTLAVVVAVTEGRALPVPVLQAFLAAQPDLAEKLKALTAAQ
jgi:exosortase A